MSNKAMDMHLGFSGGSPNRAGCTGRAPVVFVIAAWCLFWSPFVAPAGLLGLPPAVGEMLVVDCATEGLRGSTRPRVDMA